MIGLRRIRGGALVGAALATALVLAACSNGSDSSSSPTDSSSPAAMRDVTVLMDWFPNPDHVALYMAQANGYFEDAGLNVTLQPPSDPSDPPKLVSTGKVELGISYEPEQFLSGQEGLNIKAVGALIPTALNSVMATGSSPVKELCDLAGHTVGDAGLSTDAAFLSTIYKHCDIDPSSVKEVNLKTSLVSAMVSGSVDATIGGYQNIEGIQLQMMGQDPMIVPVSEAGVPNYDELVIIANADKLSSDTEYQQMVRDFLAAVQKGAQASIDDPSAAVAAMTPVAKGYNKDQLEKMVEATVPLQEGPNGLLGMSESDWDSFGQWMLDNGLMEEDVAAADIMTTEFLPPS
jgi:putative hydroxymethylpyrimidine transport system substrate-binding protein